MASSIQITAADQNRVNALKLALAVNGNITGGDEFVSNPSKSLIFRQLNHAIEEIDRINPAWTYKNSTKSFQGYDFSDATAPMLTDALFFPVSFAPGTGSDEADIDATGKNHLYVAEKYLSTDLDKALKDITAKFNHNYLPMSMPLDATITAYVCGLDAFGNPDLNNKWGTTDRKSLSLLNDLAFDGNIKLTFSQPIETIIKPEIPNLKIMKAGTSFAQPIATPLYVVFDLHSAIGFTGLIYFLANSPASSTHLTGKEELRYKTDLSAWSTIGSMPNVFLQFGYTLQKRNYLTFLTLPYEVARIQRIYQGNFVLKEIPYDKYQQFPYWMIGTLSAMYFCVQGFTDDGRMQVVIPSAIHAPYWLVDFKRKPKLLVEDEDQTDIPSEYRSLLELRATIFLIGLGYGNQNTGNLNVLLDSYNKGVVEMIRDYRYHGKEYIDVQGLSGTPVGGSGIRGLNDENIGPEVLGLSGDGK